MIVEQGPMRSLLAKLDVEGFLLDIDGALPPTLPVIEGATLAACDDHTLELDMPRAMDLNRVFAALGGAGIRVRSMRTRSNRLEELFVRLTGDDAAARRDGEPAGTASTASTAGSAS
jgi:ABC-2 type transport system ATP-binding protein